MTKLSTACRPTPFSPSPVLKVKLPTFEFYSPRFRFASGFGAQTLPESLLQIDIGILVQHRVPDIGLGFGILKSLHTGCLRTVSRLPAPGNYQLR